MTTPCPKGYEQGRAERLADSRASWAVSGARYYLNSRERKALTAVEPIEPRPRSITAGARARVLELRGQGLTCRAIAEIAHPAHRCGTSPDSQ